LLATDAGGDRFFGGGLRLPAALRRGFDGIGSLERVNLPGQFRNVRPCFVAVRLSRC